MMFVMVVSERSEDSEEGQREGCDHRGWDKVVCDCHRCLFVVGVLPLSYSGNSDTAAQLISQGVDVFASETLLFGYLDSNTHHSFVEVVVIHQSGVEVVDGCEGNGFHWFLFLLLVVWHTAPGLSRGLCHFLNCHIRKPPIPCGTEGLWRSAVFQLPYFVHNVLNH